VITVQGGSTIYVGRPDYVLNQGTAGAPSLTQGADGLYRFTDSAGNVQVLRPAFLEPEPLNVALGAWLGSSYGSFVIQTDGTGLLTLSSGAGYLLTPALTLGTAPAAHAADGVWSDGSGTGYRVYSFPNASQGVTVTPR